MGVKRIFILVLLACLGTSHYMLAKKKSTKTSLASVSVLKMSNDSTEYKKLVKDTKTKKGLFVTHFSKAHKLYFEIPDTAFFHICQNHKPHHADLHELYPDKIQLQNDCLHTAL